MKEDFKTFKAATGSYCSLTLTYFQRAWLPYEEMGAHHSVKCLLNFGMLTTSSAGAENRRLQRGLTTRYILVDDFFPNKRRRLRSKHIYISAK